MRLNSSPHTAGHFWKFVARVTGKGKSSVIPDLVDPESPTVATSSSAKATLLNTFFVSQTRLNTGSATPDMSSLFVNSDSLTSFRTSPVKVFDVLHYLPVRKAGGLDGLTPRLLKDCAPGIAESLACLFNRSFREGCFPKAWKMALVIPAFKRGDKSNPSNYRPISLLSTVGKVAERIVFDITYAFVSPHLSDHQSGFRKKDGTSLQLTRLVQQWSEALDDGYYVGVIFFDLRKAFDKVWHDGLLAKLDAIGVRGSAFDWFKNYLSGRSQCTDVEGHTSPFSDIAAGVPQGAILSPLLFLIYVNDLPSHACSSEINLFADDTSASVRAKSPSVPSDKLQSAVVECADWFERWHLSVNHQKSELLVIRSRNTKPVPINLCLDRVVIPQVSTRKHLGLQLNEFLSWSPHVRYISTGACRKLGLLRRLRKRLSPLIVQQLYCSSVRPTMEYASLAWCGLSNRDADVLERVQRRAARLVTGIRPSSDIPNSILLARAGLQPLSTRRHIEQAVFAFRFVLGSSLPHHLHLGLSHWLTAKPAAASRLRNAGDIRLPRPHKNILKTSPLYLSLSLWNSLSPEARASKSPRGLKSLLFKTL